MKKVFRNYLLLLSIAALIVLFDQWSKDWVRQNIGLGEAIYPIPFLEPFFRFTHWHNTGAAFGLFQNANMVLLIISLIMAVVIIFSYHKAIDEPLIYRLSLGMMLGGAIGNAIDRVDQGYVTDFIAAGRFPVFNVADSSVTVGVGLMLLAMLIHERQEKQTNDDPLQIEKTDDES
jgi:signal peptidase II